MDLVNCFAYKAGGCRAFKEYMGLIPKGAWLEAVFAISVLILWLDFSAREV
jgi:hypothetical protein